MAAIVGYTNAGKSTLLNAFRSTLEEARYADLILHVVDMSNPEFEAEMQVVYETLRGLDITGKPVLTVFNKCDLSPDNLLVRDPLAEKTVRVSAYTGENLDLLADTLENMLKTSAVYAEFTFPFNEAGKVQEIRKYGQLLSEEYTESGIVVKAYVSESLKNKLEKDKEER